MCFGNQQEKSQTTTPPAWLSSAGSANTGFAMNLENTGFTPYSGNQVSPFSGQQQQSFALGGQIGDSVSPYTSQIGSSISNYLNAGPSSVTPSTISSAMTPYMNQYVSKALTPQLQMQDQQFATQNKGVDAAATGAGAFGDTGWGQLRGTTTQAQDAARSGLIGNAYNTAFNTAIGAGAQDVTNNLNAQTTNANLRETSLGRQLTGATALNNTALGATNLVNTLGGQQTAQTQAQLNAAYNQYLMKMQYPFQTLSAADQALNAGKGTGPTTTVSSAPDNSGYGMLGSALGAVGGAFIGMPGLGASLGGSLGGMFGGSNTPQYTPDGGAGFGVNGQQLPGNFTPQSPNGYADGGKVKGNKPIVVGERGPEVFVPGKKGVVVPNEIMEAARDKRRQKTGSADGLSRQLGAAA